MTTDPFRILVTGWRDWPRSHEYVIHDALGYFSYTPWYEGRPIIVVQGECPYGGVDLYAKEWAEGNKYAVDPHPAERGPQGQILGPARNSRMVAAGVDVCLAFPGPKSRGTWDCASKAVDANIPTHFFAWSAAFAVEWAADHEWSDG